MFLRNMGGNENWVQRDYARVKVRGGRGRDRFGAVESDSKPDPERALGWVSVLDSFRQEGAKHETVRIGLFRAFSASVPERLRCPIR